jgi:hypothetical protein
MDDYTDLDIAWLAGIYEGEGSCARSLITVTQKDRWLLYKLKGLFGGSINDPYGTKSASTWIIYGKEAKRLAIKIYPMLSPRRQEQLKEYNLLILDRQPRTHCLRGHELNEENTGVVISDNRVKRYCRICSRANAKKVRLA